MFKLDPTGKEAVLHSFTGADGAYPAAGLIMDAEGNLYGTTATGAGGSCQHGCGVVFKLDPTGSETVLHNFTAGQSQANLTRGARGHLYGTTYGGGREGDGEVFKVSSNGKNYAVLYNFKGDNSN